jgi:hypothetical protein
MGSFMNFSLAILSRCAVRTPNGKSAIGSFENFSIVILSDAKNLLFTERTKQILRVAQNDNVLGFL